MQCPESVAVYVDNGTNVLKLHNDESLQNQTRPSTLYTLKNIDSKCMQFICVSQRTTIKQFWQIFKLVVS